MERTALVAADIGNIADLAAIKRAHCERLANQISTLASYLYAAEHPDRHRTKRRLPVDHRQAWHGLSCRDAGAL